MIPKAAIDIIRDAVERHLGPDQTIAAVRGDHPRLTDTEILEAYARALWVEIQSGDDDSLMMRFFGTPTLAGRNIAARTALMDEFFNGGRALDEVMRRHPGGVAAIVAEWLILSSGAKLLREVPEAMGPALRRLAMMSGSSVADLVAEIATHGPDDVREGEVRQ